MFYHCYDCIVRTAAQMAATIEEETKKMQEAADSILKKKQEEIELSKMDRERRVSAE